MEGKKIAGNGKIINGESVKRKKRKENNTRTGGKGKILKGVDGKMGEVEWSG